LRVRLLRAAVIVGLCAILCYGAFAFTLAGVMQTREPQAALSWWNTNAEAGALTAFQMLTSDRSPAAVARARELAEAALRREPVNVAAARTMAVVSTLSGDGTKGEQYLILAERLSRRDVATQVMLLESEVRRNNIPGALLHYDRAMRVSTDARETLLPIMVQAAAEPAIANGVGRLLDPRPPWWFPFAEHLVSESNAPGSVIFLLGKLRLDPRNDRERSLVVLALRRMVEAGAFASAERLYRQTGGSAPGAGGNFVRNGGFDAPDLGLPPFDWLYVNESGLGAYRENDVARGGFVLRLSAETERSGEVARQLLTLPPGHYRMDAVVGSAEAGSQSRLAVRCAGEGGAALVTLPFAVAGSAGAPLGGTFQVPAANCGAQWLSVGAGAAQASGATQPWIDAISVHRL